MKYFNIQKPEDLIALHPDARENQSTWRKYEAAVEGFKALVDINTFKQHSRETQANYNRRLSEGNGPNYSEAIINVFDYYISQSEIARSFGKLADFDLWKIFQKDTDYYRTDYNVFLGNARKKASIYGHVGIMIDMPKAKTDSQHESIERQVYPYLSIYTPLNIMDWIIEKDELGRPKLVGLKLKEDNGIYKIWEIDAWYSFRVSDNGKEVELINSSQNQLNEIPFIWLMNDIRTHYIGQSDLKNIADIDISIYKNLMQIEEIIDLAAFPMLRKPMKRQGAEGEEDRVGLTAVQEFDPTLGEAGKPDWMQTEVAAPIKAILETVGWKIEQIYRNATLSEMSAERKSAESGFALTIRKELLNAALVKKAKLLSEAEERIIYFWCKWVGKEDWAKDVKIERPKRFSVEQLKIDLENAILSKNVIRSERFGKELQKKLSREMMGTSLDDKIYSEVDTEIDAYTPPELPETE